MQSVLHHVEKRKRKNEKKDERSENESSVTKDGEEGKGEREEVTDGSCES